MNLGKNSSASYIIVLCCALFASAAFAQSDAEFAKANQEYAQGHFKEAISGYEALVRAGQWSANLFYDLGNAYFRTGDFGHAILNYERALALERHHPEATANLQIARDEARALEMQQSAPERYLRFASGVCLQADFLLAGQTSQQRKEELHVQQLSLVNAGCPQWKVTPINRKNRANCGACTFDHCISLCARSKTN